MTSPVATAVHVLAAHTPVATDELVAVIHASCIDDLPEETVDTAVRQADVLMERVELGPAHRRTLHAVDVLRAYVANVLCA